MNDSEEPWIEMAELRDTLIKTVREKHDLEKKLEVMYDKIACLEARLKEVNNASRSS